MLRNRILVGEWLVDLDLGVRKSEVPDRGHDGKVDCLDGF